MRHRISSVGSVVAISASYTRCRVLGPEVMHRQERQTPALPHLIARAAGLDRFTGFEEILNGLLLQWRSTRDVGSSTPGLAVQRKVCSWQVLVQDSVQFAGNGNSLYEKLKNAVSASLRNRVISLTRSPPVGLTGWNAKNTS